MELFIKRKEKKRKKKRINTDQQLVSSQRVRDLGAVHPECYVFIKPLSSGLNNLHGRGGGKVESPRLWMTLGKQGLSGSTGSVYARTH